MKDLPRSHSADSVKNEFCVVIPTSRQPRPEKTISLESLSIAIFSNSIMAIGLKIYSIDLIHLDVIDK